MRTLVGILLLLVLPAGSSAALLSVAPDDAHPPAGAELTLAVEIGSSSISCFSFSVEYDPTVLAYLGAEEGSLFSTAPEMTFFSDDTDAQGRPQPNDCLLGFGTFVDGPGTVAILRFDVLAADPTTVVLRDPVLRDADRVPIPGVAEPTAWINTSTTSTLPAPVDGLFALPNPSSRATTIHLRDPGEPVGGRLLIFDARGRLVREMNWPRGATRLHWDGRDGNGRSVANGVYVARLESTHWRATTRIVRVR